MNKVKRILAVCVIIILTISCAAIPVAAVASVRLPDFYNFPQASWSTIANPQTVAVQRFLMCRNWSNWGSVLARHGGTDGKFGNYTYEFVMQYQDLCNLSKIDGVVGRETWTAICYDLNEITPDSGVPTLKYGSQDVILIVPHQVTNEQGYVAVRDDGGLSAIFYYLGVG